MTLEPVTSPVLARYARPRSLHRRVFDAIQPGDSYRVVCLPAERDAMRRAAERAGCRVEREAGTGDLIVTKKGKKQ